MDWPSDNVSFGGILHPAKSNCSIENQKLLKVLLDEAKMTMFQRKKIDYYLRNGEAFQNPSKCSKSADELVPTRTPPRVLIRPETSKRRSKETIVKSGAYEKEKFLSLEPKVDREKEKLRLQNKMAFGKDIIPNPPKVTIQIEESRNEINRFDQLATEIKEREEWFKQMEQLGEGNKHKLAIQQEIQARVREMRRLSFECPKNN